MRELTPEGKAAFRSRYGDRQQAVVMAAGRLLSDRLAAAAAASRARLDAIDDVEIGQDI